MPNEFQRHIAMEPDESDQSKTSKVISKGKDQIGEVAKDARAMMSANPGTVTAMAILIGMAGFALGWACGQSSARRDRYRY